MPAIDDADSGTAAVEAHSRMATARVQPADALRILPAGSSP